MASPFFHVCHIGSAPRWKEDTWHDNISFESISYAWCSLGDASEPHYATLVLSFPTAAHSISAHSRRIWPPASYTRRFRHGWEEPAVPVTYSLKEENDYQIDFEEMESRITDKTKMIVVVNPSNPTGGVFSRETLEKLSEIAIRHDLLVIADEIYSQLVYDGTEHVSIASLPGMKERTITLGGFSKAYSMTGWRLGYLCAPVGIIQACVRVHQYTVTCASSFVQEAAITALTDCADDVEAMRKEYQRRKDYVVKALNEIDGISCNNPHGAFYIFVNIKSLGMTSMEVAEYLLDNAKIALVPGSAFGSEGEGYLRISYACSYEELQEACARIKKAVEELKNK